MPNKNGNDCLVESGHGCFFLEIFGLLGARKWCALWKCWI